MYKNHAEELDSITDKEERGRRFVELNVMEQVYDLGVTYKSASELPSVYQFSD